MLFSIDKNKSFVFMGMMVAIFIVLLPSLIGIIPLQTGIYIVFSVSALLMVVRIAATKKMYFSSMHLLMLTLLAYSVLTSFWADNREGHLLYIFAIGASIVIYTVVAEYFSENINENISRKILYMFVFGGVLSSLVNICYWLIYIVPIAEKQSFSQGFANSDLLACFLFLCIVTAVFLMDKNSKFNKKILVVSACIMLFSFIMAKSVIAWIFALVLGVSYILSRNSKNNFFVISIVVTAVFTAVMIFVTAHGINGKVFSDVFSYGMQSFLGEGGGFLSSGQTFFSQAVSDNAGVGLLAYLCASSGIIGVLICIILFLRNIYVLYRTGTWSSLICVLVTVILLFVPINSGVAALLLWIGLIAYNEHKAGLMAKRMFRKNVYDKIVYSVMAISVVSTLFLILSIVKITADNKFERKEYDDAYRIYNIISAVNFADSESSRMAAASLRKSGNILRDYDEAIALIDKAIKRDENNLDNVKEKALIHYSSQEYELCAQQYRIAAKKAKVNDSYNLALVKVLYKTIQTYPKGSSETKRAYEEILSVSKTTKNLNVKKEINDIADKALEFTQGELNIEN